MANKKVMEEKKVIKTLDGRFMWKEVKDGSATGVRSEGDFATEEEAMQDAGIVPTTPEVAEESVEETDDSTLEESGPAPEVVDEPVSEEESEDVSGETLDQESAE